MTQYTFKQFQTEFPDDDACLDKILEMRYGGRDFDCPGCGVHSKFHKIAKRRAYACQDCGHHVYPCVGTPFEKSRTPLSNWFFAMYLFTSSRHGVAAKEIQRQIGVTYKTAWRMCHELRKLMAQADDHDPMSGHIEVDETYVGGKPRYVSDDPRRPNRPRDNKTIVMGVLERHGKVRAGIIPDTKGATLRKVITANVQRGSLINTDEHYGYKQLSRIGYQHRSVKHSIHEYVKEGIHHVNSLEGYWSQFKRGVRGTHVHISPKHMWKYVAEFSYRYNLRKAPETMFDRLVWALSQPRLADD